MPKPETYLFVDTESTAFPRNGGMQPGQARVCQLAFIYTDAVGKTLAEFSSLIKPEGWEISAGAHAVHGLTLEQCDEHGIGAMQAMNLFRAYESMATKCVAHGESFDRRMMDIEHEYTSFEWFRPREPWFCTMRSYPQYFPKWPKLAEALHFFTGRVLGDEAHDAMNDARACRDIFFAARAGGGMKVLVACEFSGTVRDAFIALGHEALSCDLLPTETPGPHYQGDVLDILEDGWDLMIAHPPCTFLTISAAWAFTDGPYHQKIKEGTLVGSARRRAREEALAFVSLLLDAPIPRIALENPIGCISSRIRKPEQIIQPHQFGHDASKATCLWLKGLMPLRATENFPPRMVGDRPRWSNQTDSGQNKLSPSTDRWAARSLTFPRIAKAMAEQWGGAS